MDDGLIYPFKPKGILSLFVLEKKDMVIGNLDVVQQILLFSRHWDLSCNDSFGWIIISPLNIDACREYKSILTQLGKYIKYAIWI